MEFCYNDEVDFLSSTFLGSLMLPVVILIGLVALSRKKGEAIPFFIGCIILLAMFTILLEHFVCRLEEFFSSFFGIFYTILLLMLFLRLVTPSIDPGKILPTEKVAVDGNNMLGIVDWNFDKLVEFYRSMVATGIVPKLFFDNNVYRTLREDNLIQKGQSIETSLVEIFDCDPTVIVVSNKGERADPLIIEYAAKNQCCILSNDNFDKDEDAKIKDAAKRLMNRNMIFKVKATRHALVVDGLPKGHSVIRFAFGLMLAGFFILNMFTSVPFTLDELRIWW